MVNTLRHTGSEPQARLHRRPGVHGARRRRARHGRRARLRRQPVQPRLACAPAAGLLVQALRLCHRLRERSEPALDRARLRWRLRELGTEELFRRQLGALAGSHRRLPHVAQHSGRRGVAASQRRTRQGAGDDAAPGRRRRQEDLLDGARRHRHHAAAAHGAPMPTSPTAARPPSPTASWRCTTPRAISSTAAIATSRRPCRS